MQIRFSVVALASVISVSACDKSPPEPTRADNSPYASSSSENTSTTSNDQSGGMSGGMSKPSGGDPLDGHFSLSDSLKGISGTGALLAKIDTSKGVIQCRLYEDKAPLTVANFVGLATGKRPWKSPDRTWVTRPAYDGTTFHRIIRGFMIQGGDAKGDGSGEPGYVVKDEIWPGTKHDRAGQLCMANRGPNTNGAQFFITDAAAPHLDDYKTYTIFGECAPEQTIHDIAGVPVASERPLTPVTIKSVTIAREKPADPK